VGGGEGGNGSALDKIEYNVKGILGGGDYGKGWGL